MKKAYLFIYDDQVGTREQLKEVLTDMNTVWTWRFDVPHCFYVISSSSAQELYNEFINKHNDKGRFMFIEVTSNRQGMMLNDTWHLLTHLEHKPKT